MKRERKCTYPHVHACVCAHTHMNCRHSCTVYACIVLEGRKFMYLLPTFETLLLFSIFLSKYFLLFGNRSVFSYRCTCTWKLEKNSKFCLVLNIVYFQLDWKLFQINHVTKIPPQFFFPYVNCRTALVKHFFWQSHWLTDLSFSSFWRKNEEGIIFDKSSYGFVLSTNTRKVFLLTKKLLKNSDQNIF